MADTSYYKELKEERTKIDNSLRKVIAIVDKEIDKLETGLTETDEALKFIDATKEKPIKIRERIMIPIKEFPKFNFVGKILGPKGNSLKRLQEQTGCRMSVLGRGSVRSKEEEDKLLSTGDPKYNHLRQDLHVFIESYAPPLEAYSRVAHAISLLKSYLTPQDFNDDIRAAQFEELSMIQQTGPPMHHPQPPNSWKTPQPGNKKMRTSIGMSGPPPPIGGQGVPTPHKRYAPPHHAGPPPPAQYGGGYGGEMEYSYGDGYGPSGGGVPPSHYNNGSSYMHQPPPQHGRGYGRPMPSTEYNHLAPQDGYGSGQFKQPYDNSPSMPSHKQPHLERGRPGARW
ncbi:KH domain-containing, RNA-binding, signal transduction-associated protein 2-like isoform X2 [Gordionus sp. m RMFG-2023]|uniref:KH domain-containing, RNA-binding, signal transduction-associated protein 2-like isoform X2 n=1 Tax=Gordionus sp. m RMFG-2023 TaxID=3053472 RepID=UPI0031FC67A0